MKVLIVSLSFIAVFVFVGCTAAERDIAPERETENPVATEITEGSVEQGVERTVYNIAHEKMEELFETISCELERFAAYLRDNDLLQALVSRGFTFAENERDARLPGASRIGIYNGEILSGEIILRYLRIEETSDLSFIIKEICERSVVREIRIRDHSGVSVDFFIRPEHVTFLFPMGMPTDFFTPVYFRYIENPRPVPSEENIIFGGALIRDNWVWNRIPLHISPS